jgi:hypothetical protein
VPGAGGLVGGTQAAGRQSTVKTAPFCALARRLPSSRLVAQPGLGGRNVWLLWRNGGFCGRVRLLGAARLAVRRTVQMSSDVRR